MRTLTGKLHLHGSCSGRCRRSHEDPAATPCPRRDPLATQHSWGEPGMLVCDSARVLPGCPSTSMWTGVMLRERCRPQPVESGFFHQLFEGVESAFDLSCGSGCSKRSALGFRSSDGPRFIDLCPGQVFTKRAVNRLRGSLNRRGDGATAPEERVVQRKDLRSPEPCRKFRSRRSSGVGKTLVELELAFR